MGELAKNVKNFTNLKEHFTDENQLRLLTKKGVFPYDYMDSVERFQETSLPSQAEFYNKLNDTFLSDEEYLHAQEVWNVFKWKR